MISDYFPCINDTVAIFQDTREHLLGHTSKRNVTRTNAHRRLNSSLSSRQLFNKLTLPCSSVQSWKTWIIYHYGTSYLFKCIKFIIFNDSNHILIWFFSLFIRSNKFTFWQHFLIFVQETVQVSFLLLMSFNIIML